MRKILFFFIIILFSLSMNASDETISDLLSYFKLVDLPVGNEIIYNDDVRQVPKELNKLLKIPVDSVVFAYCKFYIYSDLIGLIANVSDENQSESNYNLFIIDKSGKLKKRIHFGINTSYNEYFNITKNYVYTESYLNPGRLSFWSFEEGCATYMTAHDPKEVLTRELKILSDASTFVPDSFIVRSIVDDFLLKLSIQNFEDAYKLQKNPNWGNFEHFSSTKAFGGISYVDVEKLKFVSGNSLSAVVNCVAMYGDKINGGSYIDQNFLLSKIDEKWLITGMKVNSFQKQKNYNDIDNEFRYFEFSLSNINKKGFNFYLEAVTYDDCEDYGNVATEIFGLAEFTKNNTAVFEDDDCYIYFIFSKDNSEVEITAVNYKKLYPNLNLILNKTFGID